MFNKQESMGIPGQVELESRTVKVSAKYTFNDNLILATRLDYKVVDPSGSKGILLLQDMVYRFRQLPVTLWFRYCIFQTDDWDSRLYTYENDLLYSFSIPALSGEGSRSYIMVKWEVSDIAELRVKYGLTSLIESGTSTKNNKELKIQFKIQF